MAKKKPFIKKRDEQLHELKLAGIIIIFGLLMYASPAIWNRYDNVPVIAAGEKSETESPVPRPKPEYILKAFFYQVDSGSFEKAFGLMAQETLRYTQKIYQEDFKNIYFIKLRNIELLEEKDDEKLYLVRLDVRLKGSRLKTSWQNGENKRLVVLKLVNNQWRIMDITIPKS